MPFDAKPLAALAAGVFADMVGMRLACDRIRGAGRHVVHLWAFTAHAASTGRPLRITGWEEWDLGGDLLVKASLGWIDAVVCARQVPGG